MIGKTDGVICSTVSSVSGGSSERLAPMRFQVELLGPAHVGAGGEVDGQFAAAADGLGAHLGDAEDAC